MKTLLRLKKTSIIERSYIVIIAMSFVAYTSFRSLGNNNYIQYMAICIFHSSYSIPSEISSIVPANKTLLHSQFNIFITTLQLLISTYSKQNPPTFSHDSWIMWGDDRLLRGSMIPRDKWSTVLTLNESITCNLRRANDGPWLSSRLFGRLSLGQTTGHSSSRSIDDYHSNEAFPRYTSMPATH